MNYLEQAIIWSLGPIAQILMNRALAPLINWLRKLLKIQIGHI
nr:MAG TPA: hypothetical protein [Caudoviricetes sp.]